jgi:hypothetical protein
VGFSLNARGALPIWGSGQSHRQGSGAPQPSAVSGTFTITFAAPPTFRQIDNTCFIEAPVRFDFTGDVQGSFSSTVRVVKFGACDAPASDVFQISGVFSGSVLGRVGAFPFVLAGRTDAQGHTNAQLVIGHGSGALAGLHGELTLIGQAGVGGRYSGTVHLSPDGNAADEA